MSTNYLLLSFIAASTAYAEELSLAYSIQRILTQSEQATDRAKMKYEGEVARVIEATINELKKELTKTTKKGKLSEAVAIQTKIDGLVEEANTLQRSGYRAQQTKDWKGDNRSRSQSHFLTHASAPEKRYSPKLGTMFFNYQTYRIDSDDKVLPHTTVNLERITLYRGNWAYEDPNYRRALWIYENYGSPDRKLVGKSTTLARLNTYKKGDSMRVRVYEENTYSGGYIRGRKGVREDIDSILKCSSSEGEVRKIRTTCML